MLLAKAAAADKADVPDGMSIPEELERRDERLKKLAEARTKIEARAAERLAREQAAYEAKVAAREAKAKARGKKPGGKPPAPPAAGPRPTDQINLTDEDSRIMPVAGGGFEQGYNAQAIVTADSLLVIATDVVQAANDKQQLEPMLSKLAALPTDLGRPEIMLADNGYFSAANVAAGAAAGIEPLLALGRTSHHPSLDERFAAATLSEEELDHRLFTAADTRHPDRPLPDWEAVERELRGRGVTLRLLWLEYLSRHPGGYRYTQFCAHFHAWQRRSRPPPMRRQHRAGEALEVDWAGMTLSGTVKLSAVGS